MSALPMGYAERPVALGLIEVLDRDGQPRQTCTVLAWPLTIGRALDNDVVLGDAHVAAHHARIERSAHGLSLHVAETVNGVRLGRRRLAAGNDAVLAADGEPIEFTVGRSSLRLRLPGQRLAAEVPIAPPVGAWQRFGPVLLGLVLLVAALLFDTWLGTDPDNLARAVSGTLLRGVVTGSVWCTLWALLSKTFTRQAQFGWHLRVFVYAGLALLVVGSLPALVAFAFSWPMASDYDFIVPIAIVAAALYFHLLAVEPQRRRWLKGVAATFAVVGIGLSMWFNLERRGQLGDELYMDHLFPPALRLAKPVSAAAFVDGLAPLKSVLDKNASQPDRGDDPPPGPDDEG